jgi:predicted regulator of Ras-like GTPase activity (Roadblock/LC7/MglB family)/DNA-binding response OmpR family regulator
MKTVLIVDDEVNFLECLQEGFKDDERDFTVVTASNGAKASVILSSRPVDLLITDLNMPVMDGFELLAHMSNHYPRVPAMVMTAYSRTPEIREKLKHWSIAHFIQKPIDLDELGRVIRRELARDTRDVFQGLPLPEFLHLIASERRTCTLTVEFGAERGIFHFREGTLMAAETGALRDDAAVVHMAGWDRAKIDLSPVCNRNERRVRGALDDLIRDGRAQHSIREEAARSAVQPVAPRVAPAKSAVAAPPKAGSEPREELSKHEELTTDAGMSRTREILQDLAAMPSIEAVCLVARDGFLLDSIARTGIDREMIGAIASGGFGASANMGRQLDKGEMLISMIEIEQGPVMLAPIGEDAFIVIVADKEANLGMVRLKLKKCSGALAVAAAI